MAVTSSRTTAKYTASGHRDDDGGPGMECKRVASSLTIVKKE
jgi:hypothetical protein